MVNTPDIPDFASQTLTLKKCSPPIHAMPKSFIPIWSAR